MAKTVSWMWKGKRYYGTLIRETKTHKFARTKNGKIKKIMAKTVSWMWKGKRYYGTLIRETKTHKFARTKNGKIKKIKK